MLMVLPCLPATTSLFSSHYVPSRRLFYPHTHTHPHTPHTHRKKWMKWRDWHLPHHSSCLFFGGILSYINSSVLVRHIGIALIRLIAARSGALTSKRKSGKPWQSSGKMGRRGGTRTARAARRHQNNKTTKHRTAQREKMKATW